ncbi:MAG: alanine racemase [Acidimicrobiales bacterium]
MTSAPGGRTAAAATVLARRPAWAVIDHGAVATNVALLAERADPAALCAVVKADGYGHGAVEVACTALSAGASWLAVAITAEGAALRAAGIDAPVLVLGEPAPDEWDDVVSLDLRPTVHGGRAVAGLGEAAARHGVALPVHLKVDTGMHRIGVAPAEALARATEVVDHPALVLEGVWTHCPVADEPGNPFTAGQGERFDAVVEELAAAGIRPPILHAANSAATIDHPALHHDMVRCGIAVYGLDPSPALHGRLPLRPALQLAASVTAVRVVPAGEAVSYGLRRPCEVDTVVATIPLGYADGVPRHLAAVDGKALVGGRRRPFAGTITMDQAMVDCGPAGTREADTVAVGEEVVLLGRQGDAEVSVAEWAERLGTITYEITCGIGPRVPRRHIGGGA